MKSHLGLFVFLGAFLLLLAVFLLLLYFKGDSFMFYSDSQWYINLGHNIAKYNIFSTRLTPPLVLDSLRTPLYPLFLAGIFFLGGNILVAGIIQCFLGALSALLVFKICSLIANRKIGLVCALLFGLDLHHLTSTGAIITEPLFIPLFLSFVFFFLLFLQRKTFKYLIISTFLLGLATLTRPISSYLGVIILVFFCFIYFFVWKKKLDAFFVKTIAIFGLLFFVMLLPWLIRNEIVFGKFSLSSVKDYTFYSYNLTSIHAKEMGVSKSEAFALLEKETAKNFPQLFPEELFSFKISDYYQKESLKALKGNELEYAKEHILGSGYFLMANYYRRAAFVIFGAPKESMPSYDGVSLIKQGKIFGKVIELIKKGGLPILISLFGFLISGVYVLFLLINIFYVFKTKNPVPETLLYVIVGYFALVTGPMASGGYRYPVLPFIIILAVLGFVRTRKPAIRQGF